ncbi:MAG TPA: HAD-IA family hydrolase, partial [Fimbriimonadaceae bacterium]|nr:HAD-IA family hydrolase [Fimbriimonadaceae bacterium]
TDVVSYRECFWEGLYGPSQQVFGLYDDTLVILDQLRARSVPVGIISNWDYSLHRIVNMLGLRDYLQFDLASLEEGPEKPDPYLFNLAASRFGLNTAQILYVGDNPIDDLQGARGAGMHAVLVDRERSNAERPYVTNLAHVLEVLDCIG